MPGSCHTREWLLHAPEGGPVAVRLAVHRNIHATELAAPFSTRSVHRRCRWFVCDGVKGCKNGRLFRKVPVVANMREISRAPTFFHAGSRSVIALK